MMSLIIPEKKKRLRWLWLAGALFLFVVLVLMVWNRNPAKESPDLLSEAERAWVKAHPVIRLAPDPDFPPVEYFDKNGNYRGITADYVALLEKKLGIRIEIIRLRGWDEIISKARIRQIDAYVATETPQRAEYLLFTRPFLEFPVVIIAREKVKGPLSLEKLKGMKVSVVSDYAAHNFIAYNYPKLSLDLVPDVETGLRKVSLGMSDAFVESLATATYSIEKEGITNLRIAGDSGYFYRMGFCTRKDWPELNRILEKGLAAISTDKKKAIYKKWVPVEPRSLLTSKKFQVAIISAFGVAVLLIMGIVIWNRALTRQVSRRTEELEKELSERKRMEEELCHAREGLEKRVEERTTELRNAKELLEEEISVRNRTEGVITARLRLLEFAATHTMGELLQATIDEAEALTDSLIGFYHFIEADQKTLSLQNWSTRTKAEFCRAAGKGRHYDVTMAGVWTDCISERCPVIHNDYPLLPHRKGMPPDHAQIVRELVVPVFRGDNIVAILGVGNKPLEYTSEDVEAVSLLADLAWEIAERKQAEEALHLSRFCIDKAGIGIYQSDENGTIFHVNDHACQSLGYSRAELCALSIFDIDPEITRERMLELKEILGEKGSVTHHSTHRRRDGTTFPVEITSNNLEFHGKSYGISFVKDITGRKRAEEALRESGARLKMAMDLAKLVQWEYDVESGMFTFDDQFYALYGTTAEREGGTLMSAEDYARKFLPPEEFEMVAGGVTEVLENSCNQLEHRIIRADGEERFIVVRGEIVRDKTGCVAKIRGANQDITEHKRVEKALRESESRVRRKLESILDPEGDTSELDLADILDAPEIKALMEDLYRITGIKMSIIDLKGRVLADVGWQDICLKFHRNHPETLKNCLESDTDLTVGVPQGEFKTYRCRNNMWHLVTPIFVGGRHMGNLFMGQFFFADEQIDYDLFRSQARTYGFPEEEYIAALEAVPRHSEELVNLGKAVFLRLTDIFSKLSYANIKLAHSLAERDRLTATLREANLVVENSPAVLFRWKGDDEWPVELVSGNIIQFGYNPDDFLSGSITYSSILHPDDLERVTRDVHDFCNDGVDQFSLEYRIMTKGGKIRWVNEHSNVERDSEGGVKNFEGIVIDVTERKQAEDELQRQKKLLQELNENLEKRVGEEVAKNREKDIMLIQQNRQAALGEMLDHIAHQWKQPLTSLFLVIQDLGETASVGELTYDHVKETVSITMSLLDHMTQTMDIFRGFYRPDKEKKVFSIKDSIDQALAFISPSLIFQSIAVVIEVDPGLTAFGYPKEYAQVLLNILANARDVFRKRGTEKPRVMIRAFAEGSKSVVTVTDNAGGIPEAIIGKIFDFYFTTNESGGGTGIGLYMAKNIIEKNMAGILRAENTDDGAQFRIEVSAT